MEHNPDERPPKPSDLNLPNPLNVPLNQDTAGTLSILAEQQESQMRENSQNHYFLSYSDTANLVLVSELLTNDNYVTWSRSMTIALSIRNKLGFVDGTICKPEGGELLALWTRNNHMVIAWILNSVSKGISSSIIFTDSARAIWLDLKERFQKKNGPRIFHLKNLTSLKQNQDSVTSYFSRIKSLWDEYTSYRSCCTCGKCTCEGVKAIEEFVQFEYLMIFLMGLNEEFSHSRSQVLLMDPLPPVSRAFSLMVQEEENRGDMEPKQNVVLATAQSTYNKNNNLIKRKDPRAICKHYGFHGHTIDVCYKIHGFPPGWKSKRNQKGAYNTNKNNKNYGSDEAKKPKYNNAAANQVENDPIQQCHEMLKALQIKLAGIKNEGEMASTSVQHMAGQAHFEDDWEG